MAEEADSSHGSMSYPTGREEPPERCFTVDTCKFIQKVIDRSRVVIVEGLTRLAEVLDVFRAEEAFGESSHVKIRDLEDTLKNKTTSECNREICDKVRGDPQHYLKLKSALVKTENKELLATIEKIEAECHDELRGTPQGCVCKNKTTCPLLERLKCKTKLPPETSVKSDQIKALQQDLIKVYKQYCEWENPVTGDDEEIISKMYIKPDVKLIRERSDNTILLEEQQRQGHDESIPLSYRQVFYTKEEPCSNIYVTGDAGMGKTTFCKQLLHTWCKAVQGTTEDGDSAEDLSVLKGFTFLFYVSLRETDTHYHIEDMLEANVLRDVTTDLKVSEILKTETCLIVLDGLDEWSPPSGASIYPRLNKELPGRNTMLEKCVYLTTTRNWKFDVINLKSRDVDKHVELRGFDEKSSRVFAKKLVGHLNPKPKIEKPISDFHQEVKEKNLTSLTSIPILLIKLLTLWYFDKDLGTSQVQLYCKMLDLLFEQKGESLTETTSTVTKPLQPKLTLPACFNNEDARSCLNHTPLLLCLAKPAFMSLVNKERESSLVFKSSCLDVYGIDESDVILCLKCGIFTQSKVFGNPTGRFKTYSFLHKNLQEFLAAVYVVTCDNDDDNISQLKNYCSTLDSTLEMGQVFMFVCGMNAEVGNQLMGHLTAVVSEDSRVRDSRQSVLGDVHETLIKNIQTCVMVCVTEGTSNDFVYNVNLQDYVIEYDTISYYKNHVIEQNTTTIKSVYMKVVLNHEEKVREVVEHILQLQTLEKLHLELSHTVLVKFLTKVIHTKCSTLKTLTLYNLGLRCDAALLDTILRCIPTLLGLRLEMNTGMELLSIQTGRGLLYKEVGCEQFTTSMHFGFKYGMRLQYSWDKLDETMFGPERFGSVPHRQMQLLLTAQTKHFRHLILNIYCTEHGKTCLPEKDLSNHTQLQTLYLGYMRVTNLHAVVHSVECVYLSYVTVSHATLNQFIEALARTSKIADILLMGITITVDEVYSVYIEAYHTGCGKFTVTMCDIWSDEDFD